jgi:hypothetical protein
MLESIDIIRFEGIQATLTSPIQKACPRLAILYRKMAWMIFKEYVIIMRKFMNGKKMLSNDRDM